MNPERRYTDATVRGRDDLVRAASTYAWNYTGDFDFLVAARELVLTTGTLPTAVARGVLNCMRADPTCISTLEALEDAPAEDTEPSSPPKLRVVRDVPLPWRREYPARIRETFFVSRSNGQVVHRIVKTVCEWTCEVDRHTRAAEGPLNPTALKVASLCRNAARLKERDSAYSWWAYTDNPILFNTAEQALGLRGKFGPIRRCASGCFTEDDR